MPESSFAYVRSLEQRVQELEARNEALLAMLAKTTHNQSIIHFFLGNDDPKVLLDSFYGYHEEIVALRVALRPFAQIGSEVPTAWPDQAAGYCQAPVSDLRRAYQVYALTNSPASS